jgi:hypothetical protein
MTALRVHHENLPVEVEEHIEGRVVRLGHLHIVIILKQPKQARPLRAGVDDGAVLGGRLITVAQTKRLGSKALVAAPSRLRP